MSGGDIDTLLHLWAADRARHDEDGPFAGHNDLYKKIDAIELGSVPWKSFSMSHRGQAQDGPVPSWMEADYGVCFRDPRALVKNLISNPDFAKEFDYCPYQEYERNAAGRHIHRFQNVMSGDWAWKQAVSDSCSVHAFSDD
jgi:hypothetical protein